MAAFQVPASMPAASMISAFERQPPNSSSAARTAFRSQDHLRGI